MVEEVAVVCDGYNGAGILAQVLLEPVDAFGVEVVGWLVEQQHVGLLQQQAAQSHAAALAAGQCVDNLVVGRALQRVHGTFQAVVDVPGIGGVEGVLQFGLPGDEGVHPVGVLKHVGVAEGFIDFLEFRKEIHNRFHALADDFDYGLARFEVRFLLEVSHGIARREHHFALVFLVDSCDDFQQRALARAVKTDDADFGAVEERKVYVFQNLFLWRVGLAHPHHGENYFLVVCHV